MKTQMLFLLCLLSFAQAFGQVNAPPPADAEAILHISIARKEWDALPLTTVTLYKNADWPILTEAQVLGAVKDAIGGIKADGIYTVKCWVYNPQCPGICDMKKVATTVFSVSGELIQYLHSKNYWNQ